MFERVQPAISSASRIGASRRVMSASTISMEAGSSLLRKSLVLRSSNCASVASTQRKKRSFEAR